MKNRNILIRSLLLMGLLFSATVGFNFNLYQGFEFKGFWITLPTQFFDFAAKSSNELRLNSQLIGYLFYLIFGILCLKRMKQSIKTHQIILGLYFALIGFVFLSDFYSFYQDLNNQFTGRHLRYGFSIFLYGLFIYYKLTVHKEQPEPNKEI
jgi:hypothetical protein